MKSITEIYRIGRGPSSSHTMGPEKAAGLFLREYPEADRYRVRLYGSLCLTGRGHGTDRVIRQVFGSRPLEIVFDDHPEFPLRHPNTMDLTAYRDGEQVGYWLVRSIGGGEIEIDGRPAYSSEERYPQQNFAQIVSYCKKNRLTLPQYARRFDRPELYEHLGQVWRVMKEAIAEGIRTEGILPGGLEVRRKAPMLYRRALANERPAMYESRILSAYAFAVSEQNAAGGVIATAPTCGASGVLPAVLLQAQESGGYRDDEILDALAAAGVVGNVIKSNASISGAECGCQAEIGTACCMATAALAQLRHYGFRQLEYAAENAMEHYIGLTCDPVCGLVQIPCIERNSVAAQRAVHAAMLAGVLSDTEKVSFDCIVSNMYETGRDLLSAYRETSVGGLAKLYGKGACAARRKEGHADADRTSRPG